MVKGPCFNRYVKGNFSNDVQVANKHIKTHSISLTIRGMQSQNYNEIPLPH